MLHAWTERDVGNCLREARIKEEIIAQFADEEIDGKAFAALSVTVLREVFKLKAGPIALITAAIEVHASAPLADLVTNCSCSERNCSDRNRSAGGGRRPRATNFYRAFRARNSANGWYSRGLG
jgi:hypothetical protein